MSIYFQPLGDVDCVERDVAGDLRRFARPQLVGVDVGQQMGRIAVYGLADALWLVSLVLTVPGTMAGMSHWQPWQFSLRGLLFVTAVSATVTGVYCIGIGWGFLLTLVMAAICAGGLLRQDPISYLTARGVFGTISGGALAGATQFAVYSVWQSGLTPATLNTSHLDLYSSLSFGAVVGGFIGLLVWFSWGIVGVWFISLRDFIAELR